MKLTILSIAAIFVLISCKGENAEPGQPSADSSPEASEYPLEVCVVSGEELGSMGEPVVINHEGTEVRFCCKSCLPKFEKDPAKYLAKLKKQ
jgi:hypothetical protein